MSVVSHGQRRANWCEAMSGFVRFCDAPREARDHRATLGHEPLQARPSQNGQGRVVPAFYGVQKLPGAADRPPLSAIKAAYLHNPYLTAERRP